MGAIQPWHIIVLVVVLLLLFGAKKLPDAARGLGRSMRIFKAETKGMRDDDVRGKAQAKTVQGELGDKTETSIPDDQPSPLNEPAAKTAQPVEERK